MNAIYTVSHQKRISAILIKVNYINLIRNYIYISRLLLILNPCPISKYSRLGDSKMVHLLMCHNEDINLNYNEFRDSTLGNIFEMVQYSVF